MREIFVVGVGGFCGAVARYWLSGWAQRLAGNAFPLGTWLVNILGCFALGALIGAADSRLILSAEARLFLAVGVLGSLTTFSTFSFETVELLRGSQFGPALANVAGNLIVGCAALVLGRLLVRWALA